MFEFISEISSDIFSGEKSEKQRKVKGLYSIPLRGLSK